MGKGALRPFFKGHSLKKEKEHEKKEVDKMLLHFVTLPFLLERQRFYDIIEARKGGVYDDHSRQYCQKRRSP